MKKGRIKSNQGFEIAVQPRGNKCDNIWMRIPRFYIAAALVLEQQLALPTEIHRHAIQVLRLQCGAALILFNGQGGEYQCQIQTAEKRHSSVVVQTFHPINRESSQHITLLQSLIKPDKMDFCIQKSVELGVSAIQPLITARSVGRIRASQLDKKMQRWQGIITAACEQSGRTIIPTITAPMSLTSYLQQHSDAQRLMMLPEAEAKLSTPLSTSSTELIVGPEGGFTAAEIQLCRQHQVKAIQFGTRILRAETAALAGLSLLQAYSGNL